MSTPKYKINESVLDTNGGIAKLEKDGFTRSEIHRQMYHVTRGASSQERNKIMRQLYDRKRPC